MKAPHKINELRNFMKNQHIDILFVQETKIIHYKEEPNIKETKLSDGTKYIHSTAIPGKNNKGASGGMAALVSPHSADHIVEVKAISSRILYIRIVQNINGVSSTLHLYGVYAPTGTVPNGCGRNSSVLCDTCDRA